MTFALRSLALASLVALTACGTTYRPGRLAADPSVVAEIDDADVQKAFAAKPQLPAHPTVAYFIDDPGKDAAIGDAMRAVPGVGTVYGIPTFEVTGRHRFEEPTTAVGALSIKKLRLLAARAHSDVLVVVDYGSRTTVDANGWAALNVLVVPALFVPFRDMKVESALDAYVIDTRNGYLYGHVSLERANDLPRRTIYAGDAAVIDAQWKELVGELGTSIAGLIDAEHGAHGPT